MPRTKCPRCNKCASYAFAKSDEQWFCKEHATEQMINVKSKRCLTDGCEKQPHFANRGEKASHCKEHASEQMIDVKHKRCLVDGCEKCPAYANRGKKASHCKEHATEQMIDVKSKRCLADGCEKCPAYANRGKKASHCKEHATKSMINVKNKRCLADGCEKQPAYANGGEKPSHCKEHATKSMINVKNKRCLADGCEKQPVYANRGEKASHCKEHATKQMINVVSKRCLADGCETRPNYANRDERASHCKEHASEQMIDVVNKRCATCRMTSMNSKYKPNCSQCHFYLNPDDPRIRNYKTKESAVMSVVQASHPEIVLDARVSGGCSRRRPDGYIDRFSHVIIVEVDENEHRSYDDSCSNRRTMELYEDFGNRPLVFVRLNPDAYTLNGKRMKGSFSVSKSDGHLKANAKELACRCTDLLDTIDHHVNIVPIRAITVEYLYFSD